MKRYIVADTQNDANTYIKQIQSIKPRIDQIIKVANQALNLGLYVAGCKSMVSTVVGLLPKPSQNTGWTTPTSYPYVGCPDSTGWGYFYTNGSDFFSCKVGSSEPREFSIQDCQSFIKNYNDFETFFYKYIQKLIDEAQAKQN